MKISTFATVFWFGLTLFYKLYADPENHYWQNAYWTYTPIYLGIICFELYPQLINKTERLIWAVAGYYWLSMCLLHIYLFFNIALYDRLVTSANKITVGATFLLISLIFLTYKAWKNDKNDER